MAAETIVLTPTGGTAQALLTGNGAGPGIHLIDWKPPVTVDEVIAVDVPTADGRRPVRTRALNPTGSGRVRIEGASASAFYGYLNDLQNTVGAIKRAGRRAKDKVGGTLKWTPADGTLVTFDIVAIEIPDIEDHKFLKNRHVVIPFTFECRPYGRLASTTLVTNANGSDPLLTFAVEDVPGQVDALGELTLTDTATQTRWHGEWGLDENPLFYEELVTEIVASLHWRLGSSAGLTDQSGNSRNGTALGGVTVGGYSTVKPLTGDNSVATDFDNSDDAISSTYNPFTNATIRTFSGWAYRDTSTGVDTLFGSDTGTDNNRVALHLASGSQDVVFAAQAGGTTVTWTAGWPGNTQWVHWALVFDESANTAALYINGVLVSSQSYSPSYNATPGNLVVGARGTSTNPFDGKMAHFSVFEKALTAAEIRQLYQAGRPYIVDSDHMTALGGSATTRSGAYDGVSGGNSVIRGTLTTTPLAICSTGELRGGGRKRLKVRCFASGTGTYYLKAVYRIGDGPWVEDLDWTYPLDDVWCERDLGSIWVPDGETYEVRYVAKTLTPGDTLDIDVGYSFPADRWGKGRYTPVITTPTAFSARDEFAQAAGNLNAKTAPVGGNWATSGGAGDYQVSGAGKLTRATVAAGGPRTAELTLSSFSDIGVAIDFMIDVFPGGSMGLGVKARGKSLMLAPAAGTSNLSLNAALTVPVTIALGTYYRIVMLLLGDVMVAGFGPPGAEKVVGVLSGMTGSGTAVDIYEENLTATVVTRTYDNFAAWIPESNAAIYSLQSARFNHEAAERENLAGTRWGKINPYIGDRLLIPAAGREDAVYRMAAKVRRNDVDKFPDDQIADALRADLTAQGRVLLASSV